MLAIKIVASGFNFTYNENHSHYQNGDLTMNLKDFFELVRTESELKCKQGRLFMTMEKTKKPAATRSTAAGTSQ